VPKPLKVVVWIAALALAAAAGAFMASRSDPFPPGVEDPGARPTPSTTAGPEVWKLTMHADSQHVLHEGGSCTSDWIVEGSISAAPGGALSGIAVARLDPPAGCDFDQAQVQTRRLTLEVSGSVDGHVARLAFRSVESAPTGSQDLGGFEVTLPGITPAVRTTGGRGASSISVEQPDGDLGHYRSSTVLQLRQ
jgi:hypothetical protein